MTHENHRKFWKSFFQVYRNLPELWHISCEAYRDKEKKQLAWERLLEKYKEYDEDASLETVKKKLHNIRSSIGREVRKVNKSLRKGCDPKRVYKPTLWYYYELSFLRLNGEDLDKSSVRNEEDYTRLEGHYKSNSGKSKKTLRVQKTHDLRQKDSRCVDSVNNSNPMPIKHDLNHDGECDDEQLHSVVWEEQSDAAFNYVGTNVGPSEEDEVNRNKDNANVSGVGKSGEYDDNTTTTPGNIVRRRKSKEPRIELQINDRAASENLLHMNARQPATNNSSLEYGNNLYESRDEATIYAEGWATSYRKLSKTQRIMARKAIEEIFFLGEMEQLTHTAVIMP